MFECVKFLILRSSFTHFLGMRDISCKPLKRITFLFEALKSYNKCELYNLLYSILLPCLAKKAQLQTFEFLFFPPKMCKYWPASFFKKKLHLIKILPKLTFSGIFNLSRKIAHPVNLKKTYLLSFSIGLTWVTAILLTKSILLGLKSKETYLLLCSKKGGSEFLLNNVVYVV